MRCSRFADEKILLAHGELDAPAEAFTAHLAVCEPCVRDLEEIESIAGVRISPCAGFAREKLLLAYGEPGDEQDRFLDHLRDCERCVRDREEIAAVASTRLPLPECEKLASARLLLVYGELDREPRDLAEHLASCPACVLEIESMDRIRRVALRRRVASVRPLPVAACLVALFFSFPFLGPAPEPVPAALTFAAGEMDAATSELQERLDRLTMADSSFDRELSRVREAIDRIRASGDDF